MIFNRCDGPILFVNLARLYLVLQSNTNLGVVMKIFCRCDKHLQSVDFKERRLYSIIWVNLIQSVERPKNRIEVPKQEEILPVD